MTALTAEEQMMLEFTNRARLDPLAEAARVGLPNLNQDSGTPITADPKQPLAGSNLLSNVSASHNNFVWDPLSNTANGANLAFDPHNGVGDKTTVDQRLSAAGYDINRLHWGENFAYSRTSFALTTSQTQTQLQTSQNDLYLDLKAKMGAGAFHRLAMLDPNVKEMGVDVKIGTAQGLNQISIIENFGVSSTSTNSFLTGAVYNDSVIKDDFYSVGEAVAGVTAKVTNAAGTFSASDVTGTGGGWSVSEPNGTFKVTFSGGGVATQSATIEAGNLNAKVDLVNGTRIDSSASATLNEGGKDLRLLGIANINGTGNDLANVITGNKGANILNGKGGNDTINGAEGIDTVVFSGAQANYKVTALSGTTATIVDTRGIDGTDTIVNVEKVQFSDSLLNFSDLKLTPTTPVAVAGSVTIKDAPVIAEGASGQTMANFTVTRSGGTAAFDIKFATADGTATAASGDYVAQALTNLHFNEGETTKTISVAVKGDTVVEANETFKVLLSGATNGATIADAEGLGTINNDDVAPVAGSVTIKDAPVITEGASGQTMANFTVTRSGGTAAFDIKFATADGTATAASGDYVAQALTNLHFNEGETTKTISVAVKGDTVVEANETFKVLLSGATNGATISDAEGLGTINNDDAAAPAKSKVAEDFNGDKASDILWHNTTTGAATMWQMDGNKIVSNTNFATIAKGWHAEGTSDFTGDGKADILLRSDSGSVALWQMDGNKIVSNVTFGSIGSGWSVAGVADFSGDGKADILWKSTTGQVAMWQMDGNKILANVGVTTLGSGWSIDGTGDFDGNGKADVLLRHTGGDVAMWQMDGNKIATSKTFGTIATDWRFAGAGDIGGDGKDDIIWRSDAGKIAAWQMNGTAIVGNDMVGSTDKSWGVADVGDYNHDGQADLLLQGTNGQVAMWQMDGAHVEQNVGVGSNAGWLLV